MRVVLARASTRYQGRIDAQLNMSDVVILLRTLPDGDGSVLVYALDKGVQPKNWMPAGSIITEHDWGFDIWHEKKGERLEIFVEQQYSSHHEPSVLQGELIKLGDERAFADALAAESAKMQSGIIVVAREYMTPAGPIDILAEDKDGPICIEVKRRKVTLADTYQLQRYLHALPLMDAWLGSKPRGLLVAPSLANNAKERLSHMNEPVDFVRLKWEDMDAAAHSKPKPKKKRNNGGKRGRYG